MIDKLEIFTNATILFLENIEYEVDNVTKFEKIDFLYDILDNIYECKLILNQFNKNLFKAIEKGILTFKIDINDFKELIIGDLLYITDFLSININKNTILMKSYDKNTREELTIKLRNCRNMFQFILDSLMSNIYDDYKNEMLIDNSNSIKLNSEIKSKIFLNKIENKSNDVTSKIKGKINYIKLYVLFSEILDYINNINNKTIIELIDIMNNNFLKKNKIRT